MTITTLDEKSALIIVDLQKGIISNPSAHPVAGIVAHAVALADAFRRRNLPVVLVHVAGLPRGRTDQALSHGPRQDDWMELIAELGQHPRDYVVSKQTWGAFTHTGLQAYLDEEGITQVVIAGIATSLGVESTARQAHELGYNVTLPVDAMTDRSAEAHRNSTEHIFPRLGETGTTEEIITVLSPQPPRATQRADPPPRAT